MVTTITTVTMLTLDLSMLETSFQHCITKLGAYSYQLNLRFLPQFVRKGDDESLSCSLVSLP
jgi:hypothetical protein